MKAGINYDMSFIDYIGQHNEPSETSLIVDLARDYWTIWPKISAINIATKRSVAESNIGTALLLINSLDDNHNLDQEQLLLAALDKNVGFVGGV
jgi:hypothetical protein